MRTTYLSTLSEDVALIRHRVVAGYGWVLGWIFEMAWQLLFLLQSPLGTLAYIMLACNSVHLCWVALTLRGTGKAAVVSQPHSAQPRDVALHGCTAGRPLELWGHAPQPV